MTRPRPVADEVTQPFWDAVDEGRLVVQRCDTCGRFQQPPSPVCGSCTGAALRFQPVSGQARLHSWTVVHNGARHPYWVQGSPYIVALAELVEQPELFLYSNLPGTDPAELVAGSRLTFAVERQPGGRNLPQFVVTP